MAYAVKLLRQSKVLIRLLSLYRGLLSENKIPDTLFQRLKYYIPELSENIPDLDKINKYLKADINYLNSREEFVYINRLKKMKKNKKVILYPADKTIKIKTIKYYNVRIIGYEDIIEVDAIRDRVFIVDINMDVSDSIYNILLKENPVYDKNFYYRVKLSTLGSTF